MALFNTPKKRKQGFKLALLATCLAFAVVMLGAFTRLVDAGLGCPDWPGCYGHLLWPNDAEEIARADQLFPHAPVETHKTWPEMVHRYFAGALGLLIIGIAWISWRNGERPGQPFRLPILLLFLVVWQAMFGMWTVTLKLWPQVVTIHLLGGMSILSLLWLLTLRLDNRRWTFPEQLWTRLQSFKPWLILAVIVVVFQILLGGWLSANYAAFACHDFPTCHNSWWPEHMNFKDGFNLFQDIGPNYLGGLLESDARTAIHMAHRLGALVTMFYLLGLAGCLWMTRDLRVRRMVVILLLVLAVQLALGISNILFQIPLSIAVLHNGVGALLLITVVTFATRIWMAESEEQ